MELLYPWALALLPLPFVVRRLLPAADTAVGGELRVPFFARLASAADGGRRVTPTRPWRVALALAIWTSLVLAVARPVLLGEAVPLPVEARDLMLAIDLSGSMEQQDLALDGRPSTRLGVVKAAADDFIERRSGDRVGLVLFGERAYLQSPLTLDREVVRTLLDEAEVGLTGKRTALGDAIAIAVKRLRDRPVESRVIVLLTDGASNAGALEPMAAARLAESLGIRVYTIGVGAERQRVNTAFGPRVVDPSADLDERTLEEVAELTGGRYFRARDVEELAGIYAMLDELEPVSGEPLFTRSLVDLFFWPLGVAVALAFLWGGASLAPSLGRVRPFGAARAASRSTELPHA